MGDWPPYYMVTESEEDVYHVRMEYAALITMCDHYLGKVLDKMDKYNLWEDTLLIVNTDHGFLLGEHGWWSKTIMPIYEEIARTPLFVYDPRSKVQGERRDALTQTIDLPVTILDYFGLDIPKDMQGKSLRPIIERKEKVREYALFGYHDAHCNLTDGNWVYMKAPLEGTDIHDYTLMPTHMNSRFSPEELQDIQLQEPFSFTKGCRTMKIKANNWTLTKPANFGTKLFCLEKDPKQENPIMDIVKETEPANEMLKLMRENECPSERFAHFGFPAEGDVTEKDIKALRKLEREDRIPEHLKDVEWTNGSVNMYHAVKRFMPEAALKQIEPVLLTKIQDNKVTNKSVFEWIEQVIPVEQRGMINYFVLLSSRTA